MHKKMISGKRESVS